MQYRPFGKLGFNVSTFGLGCMRLPVCKDENGQPKEDQIDEQEAIKMIRYAIDHGVNYIDTAYIYHGGNSEALVGKALGDGYREKVLLTTKLPIWLTNTYEDFERILDEQLQRLGTDYLDFYLIHAISRETWDKVKNIHIFDFCDKVKKSGKVKHIGFSFHDELDVFHEVVDAYPWDLCQIQLNIIDVNYQAGIKGLRYAGDKGIPVVIMEPLKGGVLANHVPNEVLEIYKQAKEQRTPAEWAFRWVANFPEVVTILSGTSLMEQTADNIRIFDQVGANILTAEELEMIEKVQQTYEKLIRVGCTNCKYCMPCPKDVNIPQVFEIYNRGSMFSFEDNQKRYQDLIKQQYDATKCVACGKCEDLCPQGLPIISKLKEAQAFFC